MATFGKTVLASAGALTAALLAACSQSSGRAPAPGATERPPSDPTAYLATLVARETAAQQTVDAHLEITPFCAVDLADSWRAALEAGRVSLPDSAYFYTGAVAPDGSRVFGRFNSDAWSGVAAVSRDGTITRIRAFANPRQDQMSAAFDGRWLVWQEGHSITNWNDWDMRAWDSTTGNVFDIATAPRVNGAPVSGPFVIPVIADGRAAWLQPNESGKLEVHLYDLRSRQDRVVSQGDALLPVVFWGSRLLWGESFTENGQRAGHLIMIDATTGKHLDVPEPLASIRSFGTMSAGGDLLAWAEGAYVVATWRTGDQKVKQIVSNPNGQVDWVRIAGDQVVEWQGLLKPMVADLRSGSSAPLTQKAGSAFTNGDMLAVSVPIGPMIPPGEDTLSLQRSDVEVVDVTKLPPLPGCPS